MTTPGVRFLFKASIYAYLYVAALSLTATNLFSFALPLWCLLLLAVSLAAVVLIAKDHIRHFKHAREAAALGARVAPRVRGKLPFNLDLLARVDENTKTGYPWEIVQELKDKYGEIYDVDLLGRTLLTTTSPKYIQAILATQFDTFEKGPIFRKVMSFVLGDGIFNADGDMWRFHRSLTRPFFSRDRITHFDLFDRHATTTISKMQARLRLGVPVDFQDIIQRFTMDTASEFLFGSCVDSLSAELPFPRAASASGSEFADVFVESLDVLARRERLMALYPLVEIWKDKMVKPLGALHRYLEPLIKEAIQRNSEHTSDSEEADTVLDHLVRSTTDISTIRDEIINILIAGRDTTASTLSFIVYFLAIHPDVMRRLRDEVLETVGAHRRPEFADIKELKYMRAVINETLRLYPPVPANVRQTREATTFPAYSPGNKPVYIPANTQIAYSVMIMQRRKDLWGPDADEFDPDRFIDARLKQYLVPNPFIFLPFNAGPRICIGQQFAYNEISFILVRLMQSFRAFTLHDDIAPPPAQWKGAPGRKGIERVFPKVNLTLSINGGLWISGDAVEE